jgi:hypothetical protein
MDAYLELAEDVLRRVRRPLSAMQILQAAYSAGIAPARLRGRTQHKTLGARLSEDILLLREDSRFYRTAPGRFLLRELANDPSIPSELRKPIIARRRKRDLPRKCSLAFEGHSLDQLAQGSAIVNPSMVFDLISRGNYCYVPASSGRSSDEVAVWAFTLVIRSGRVLSYRQGAYREGRDTFMNRRTIGFYTPVVDEDLSLFEQEDHGIVSSGLRALATDLDLPGNEYWPILNSYSELRSFVISERNTSKDLLAVVAFSCPDWLDPLSKRLAINDLEWLDLRVPLNHEDDFDPWSQAIMPEARRLAKDFG